ncbi:MraY family glycosyltransferase [Algoriphagus namhaensis]
MLKGILGFGILLCLLLVYFFMARRFGIVDKPNERSSHSKVTIRGGGIIFPIAAILWWFLNDYQNTWMILGIAWISAISFLDDIYGLSGKLRFLIQFIAISMAFYDLDLFSQISPWALPFLYFIALGIINAINFMDGINGITGLYGIVFFGTVLAANTYLNSFPAELIQYEILAICAFLLFNLRKKALMFAGDIGSVSLAYLMVYFMTQWYLESGSWTVILLLVVYGVDTFVTMIQRFLNKEKLSEPHRKHLYQVLANEGQIPHVIIALIYAALQTGINLAFYISPQDTPDWPAAILILLTSLLLYLVVKNLARKRFVLSQENS